MHTWKHFAEFVLRSATWSQCRSGWDPAAKPSIVRLLETGSQPNPFPRPYHKGHEISGWVGQAGGIGNIDPGLQYTGLGDLAWVKGGRLALRVERLMVIPVCSSIPLHLGDDRMSPRRSGC